MLKDFVMELRRRLYTRGSSYETTVPMPLLFSVDKKKKYEIIFTFDSTSNKWFIKIEEARPKGVKNE